MTVTELSLEDASFVVRYGRTRDRYLYKDGIVPTQVLMQVYEFFGGLDAFTAPKLRADMKELRNSLLQSQQFPVDTYNEILDGTAKIVRKDIIDLGSRNHVFRSFDLFKRLWDVSPDEMMQNFYNVTTGKFFASGWEGSAALWEKLDTPYDGGCPDRMPNQIHEHWTGQCEFEYAFRADHYLTLVKAIRDEHLKHIDPRVMETIRDGIMGCSKHSRWLYASTYLVDDSHWEALAVDSNREVINSLAENPLLPHDVAMKMALAHKTPFIRKQIARYTTSKEVLDAIWDSTKAPSIRASVYANPLSERAS